MFNEKVNYTYEGHGDMEDVYDNKVKKKKERKKKGKKKKTSHEILSSPYQPEPPPKQTNKHHPNLPKDRKEPSRNENTCSGGMGVFNIHLLVCQGKVWKCWKTWPCTGGWTQKLSQ